MYSIYQTCPEHQVMSLVWDTIMAGKNPSVILFSLARSLVQYVMTICAQRQGLPDHNLLTELRIMYLTLSAVRL